MGGWGDTSGGSGAARALLWVPVLQGFQCDPVVFLNKDTRIDSCTEDALCNTHSVTSTGRPNEWTLAQRTPCVTPCFVTQGVLLQQESRVLHTFAVRHAA